MFEKLDSHFSPDGPFPSAGECKNSFDGDVELKVLFTKFGGCSFNKGLYRVLKAKDVPAWNSRVGAAFSEFSDRITTFGIDWLGRVFATSGDRRGGGQFGVIMFEPGTGEALEIPASIGSFHDEEIIKYSDAALASNFHRRWLEIGGRAPEYSQCVGYKKPLFLGGIDDVDNLVLSDIDVYWHLCLELLVKIRDLPDGTPISISGDLY